jgi:hypothetical protein
MSDIEGINRPPSADPRAKKRTPLDRAREFLRHGRQRTIIAYKSEIDASLRQAANVAASAAEEINNGEE